VVVENITDVVAVVEEGSAEGGEGVGDEVTKAVVAVS
jgi:hypothetical protein